MEDLITNNDNTLRAPGIQMEIVNIQAYLCQHGFNRQRTKHNDTIVLEPRQQIAWATNSPSPLNKDPRSANITGNQMCHAVNAKPLDIDDRDTIMISDKFTVYNNPYDDHIDDKNSSAPSQAYMDTGTKENSFHMEYQSHLQHQRKKPYQCKVRHSSFAQGRHLNQHKHLHTMKKPFKCDVCQKCFRYTSALITHKRIHTGEKPFQCGVCAKCFTRANVLNQHKLLHTGEKPFQCDVCEKRFTQAIHLTQHKRIHTGEKPFQCDVCQKCFRYTNGLMRHKRIHTGEKPFQCDICQKCFT